MDITTSSLPDGRLVRYMHRDDMRSVLPPRAMLAGASWPKATLPVDSWAAGLTFPIDGNDRLGDCGEAMACHGDNTLTGANGKESTFDEKALEAQYRKYSGGDRGLSEDAVVALWKAGLAGDASAIIHDHLDIDATDPDAMAGAVENFGVVCLALSLPNSWERGFTGNGCLWGGSPHGNPFKGHFVLINGVDKDGRLRTQTWGSFAWIESTKSLANVQPSAFTVFSPRWFSPTTGLAPNGKSYQALASLWQSLGGASLPPGPTPVNPPAPPPPPPAPDKPWSYSD